MTNTNEPTPRIDARVHDTMRVCKGPNKECRAAHRAGRSVHITPAFDSRTPHPRVVLATYHYATEEEALLALARARTNARIIMTDDDLYAAREANEAYILMPGWIDPSRRR